MSNPDYDKKKFDMDEYGNLCPKKTKEEVDADNRYGKWVEKCKDKLDNSTNVKTPKGK